MQRDNKFENLKRTFSAEEQQFGPSGSEPSTNGATEDVGDVPSSPAPVSPTVGLTRTDNSSSEAAYNQSNGFSYDMDGATASQVQSTSNPALTPLLNPLDQEVPDTWVTVEDEFVFVVGVYLTHLSKDMITAPNSKLDDGIIYLSLCRGGVTRLQLLGMFNDMETGNIKERANLEIVKVKAFRIEPLSEKGIVTVDGEVVDYGPLQAQILPSMARIMTPSKV